MSSREFAEWAAYWSLEPWGWEADSWRTAMLASIIANTARDPKKRRRPFTVDDFLPKLSAEIPTPASVATEDRQAALRSKLDAAMLRFGGRKKES